MAKKTRQLAMVTNQCYFCETVGLPEEFIIWRGKPLCRNVHVCVRNRNKLVGRIPFDKKKFVNPNNGKPL